jgi:nifR3 family TIM-barrel protein
MLRIADLQLQTPLLLAPIAGYCDLAFRLVARSCGGVGLACTDLLDPEAIARETPKTLKLAATNELDSPLSMQLYGGNPDCLADAARWAEDRGAHVVDINMGCPVDKVLKKDGGSKLLCDPDGTLRLVEKVRAALKHTPLTAKMRLGWDDRSIVAPQLARRLEDAGVAMVTVHGRTTEMKFSGEARLDGIAQVVAAVKSIPVIGNGDVRTPHHAQRMMQATRCAGIMIGRAALARPWLFAEIWSYLTTGAIPPEPSATRKCQLMTLHFQNMIRYRGERYAVQEFRKRVSWWAKSMHPCRMLKEEMRQIQSPAGFDAAVARFLEWRLAHDERISRGLERVETVEAA